MVDDYKSNKAHNKRENIFLFSLKYIKINFLAKEFEKIIYVYKNKIRIPRKSSF